MGLKDDAWRRDIAAYPVRFTLPTRYGDMDANAHLNNVAIARLIEERHPAYQTADITIASRDVPHDKIVEECVEALHHHLCRAPAAPTASETP